MTPRTLLLPVVVLSLLVCPALLHAQSTRTWVSGVGDDANPGSRTAPCKTFAGAISKTTAGGIITVLDPGGFGAVTITKAITIEGDANEGAILVSGTNGINVAAGATDVVTLRGLSIEGLGTGLTAISISQAGAVHIEHCQINGFITNGISLSTSNVGAQLFIKDTTIHNCNSTGPTAASGVLATPSAAAIAHISNCHITDCGNGVSAAANSTVLVNDTDCGGNSAAGFVTTAGTSPMVLINCTSSANHVGVQSAGNISLTGCSVLNNVSNGLKGTIDSFGNNEVSGNNPNGTATTVSRE